MNNGKLIERRFLQAYQCDRFGNMRPLILMNELQGMGDKHAEQLGVGYEYCEAHGIAWVVTHYLVDIIEMPTEREELQIITWPSVSDSLRATRDFEIRGSDGRLMVRATSQWILIDLNTRRPVRMTEHLPPFDSLTERAWDRTFDKFPEFDATKTHIMKCRFDDIDVNQHINNAVYAVWATESVGYEYRSQHQLKRIELNFRKEIKPDTPSVEIDVAIDGLTSYHRIRTGDTEHAIVMCTWMENK
ncbi:MAG: thioesterase [Muribaculaceae bacterium]|nr:thioesterase [Muribaculaceae bacterium]